jgi:hypothetical protein
MKLLFFLIFSFLCSLGMTQKQYSIEYDRIKNTESYFQLQYNKGAYTKVPVKRIAVKNGDLIRFSSVNVNPLKLRMQLAATSNSGDSSPMGAALGGFGQIISRSQGVLSDVGDELISLKYNQPELPQFNNTRGSSLAPQEQMRLQSLVKLSAYHSLLLSTYSLVQSYNNISEIAYCTHLTKDEILKELNSKKEGLDNGTYEANLRELKKLQNEIHKDPLLDNSEYSDLDTICDRLINQIEGTLASPLKIDDLISTVNEASFTQEQTVIVGYDSRYEEYSLGDASGYSNFSIEFSDCTFRSEGNDNNYRDDLLQNHRISVPYQTQSSFAWTTGAIYVAPFSGGFLDFGTRESELSSDSAQVFKKGKGTSGRITLGTSLQYNFPSSKSLIPHALFGMSVSFLSDSYEKPLNFLLGGGLKIKQFPYLSLSAGVSFCQNRALKEGIKLDTFYDISNSDDVLKDLTRRVFSPGWFLGLNVNL